jgi:serine/threonine protein kinase
MSNLIGQTIGNYQIEALLGSGGMGQVFRARHIHLGRRVALKLMHEHLAHNPIFQERFLHEARTIAALQHPHIIEIYDFVVDGQAGRAYLVMEFAEYGSLRAWLRQHRSHDRGWSLLTVLDLLHQASEALAHAHTQGVIHGDIKPDNLLLATASSPSGLTLKVADFGLAHIAESEHSVGARQIGSPAYMSPEQCQGLPLDPRSDIYTFGVVLYEVTVGRRPFISRTAVGAIYKHLSEQPLEPRQIRPELPVILEQIILRCMSKRADERFDNAAALATALAGAQTESPDIVIADLTETRPTPMPDAQPHIRVLDDQGSTLQLLQMPGTTSSVGCAADNRLILEGAGISRHHLRLTWDGQQMLVTDLGSNLGTFLNEVRIPASQAYPWPLGTRLRVGPYWLCLEQHKLPAMEKHCD